MVKFGIWAFSKLRLGFGLGDGAKAECVESNPDFSVWNHRTLGLWVIISSAC